MKRNKKIKLIIAIITIIIILLFLLILLQKTNIISTISNVIKQRAEDIIVETQVKYEITQINGKELNIVIIVENQKGIDKITVSNLTINCNGKTRVALDRTVEDATGYDVKVKLMGEELEEKYTIIAVNEQLVQVSNIDTLNDGTTKTIKVNGSGENIIKYYSLDDGETWKEYTGEFDVLETENYTITAKLVSKDGITIDNGNGKISLIVSESLISATGNAIMKNNNYYRIAIKDKQYNAHTYVENGDLILESNKIYGDAGDVATDSSNAKNMVIVKVKGNLTINEGVTVAPYYSNNGGPKGFLLYCAETLTDNGVIQNSYGAKAEGEDVYLWKNKNSTYEYVPALGASGASRVSASQGSAKNGNSGENVSTSIYLSGSGVKRATAGGGSGGVAVQNAYYSQNGSIGGTGTSYGAGAGGGGTARHSNNYSATPNDAITTSGGSGAIMDGSYDYFKCATGGGAGASVGFGVKSHQAVSADNGSLGTGGLLIAYAKNLVMGNNSLFCATGANGGSCVAGGGDLWNGVDRKWSSWRRSIWRWNNKHIYKNSNICQ